MFAPLPLLSHLCRRTTQRNFCRFTTASFQWSRMKTHPAHSQFIWCPAARPTGVQPTLHAFSPTLTLALAKRNSGLPRVRRILLPTARRLFLATAQASDPYGEESGSAGDNLTFVSTTAIYCLPRTSARPPKHIIADICPRPNPNPNRVSCR